MTNIFLLEYICYGHVYDFYRDRVEVLTDMAFAERADASEAAKVEFEKRNRAAYNAMCARSPGTKFADYQPDRPYSGEGAGDYEGFAIRVITIPLVDSHTN